MVSWFEIVGYVASALIVVSLAMTSVVRLRIVNLVGCVTFVTYGLLIHAWPVVVSNAIICVLNVWFLAKHFRTRTDVGAVPIAADAPYLADFLTARLDDIQRDQPTFAEVDPTASAWLLTRDGLPVGVLVGRREQETLHIDLDYVTAPYRDSRLGQWLHGPTSTVFTSQGIRRLTAHAGSAKHRAYLTQVGFHADGSDMVKDL